jgi:PGF-pre-PGF domain-containing protein
MNKTFLIFVSAILLIGMVSATTQLQEFMSDDATSMKITMTQDETTDVFTIDTAGLSFDTQPILLPNGIKINGYSTISVPISGLLNGVNLRVDLNDGATHPVFSEVSISNTNSLEIFSGIFFTEVSLLNLISGMSGKDYNFTGDVTQDNLLLNTITQQNSLPTAVEGDSSFEKDGTTYTIEYSKGFGSIPCEYKNEIGKAITKGVNSMNVKELLEQTIPSVSIDDYLPVLENLGYEVSEEDIDFAHALLLENTNYNVSVDLTNLAFQDGTYQIPVTITPLLGEDKTPVIKTITLVLSGIINSQTEETTTENVYTPSDEGVKEVISSITGLPIGTVIEKMEISDTKPATVEVLTHTTGLKYLIIEVDTQPISNAQINFTIEKSKVDNENKISLYVWEPTTSSWAKLTTTYIGETTTEYEYTATTPHFSTFMIGEDTTSSSSEGSHSHGGGSHSITSTTSNTTSNEDTEVEVPTTTPKETEEKTFLQQILEFLGLTGRATEDGTADSKVPTIVPILGLMIVIAVTIILVVKKRK